MAASLSPLLEASGQIGASQIRSVSGTGLQTSSTGAITELVSDWLISWYLMPSSAPHSNAKIALCQMYVRDHLLSRFPKSLSPEKLNTAVFWAATSAWASSTKRSVCDKLVPIAVQTANAIKVAN